MQHITTADKSFLVGSEVAELLMRYAALTAQISGGELVKIRAFGADGDEVTATILLNSGTEMTAETVNSSMAEPDNSDVEAYLRTRLASYDSVSEDYPEFGGTGDTG